MFSKQFWVVVANLSAVHLRGSQFSQNIYPSVLRRWKIQNTPRTTESCRLYAFTSSQPVSADPDAEQGGWSIQQITRHNRRSSRNAKSSSNSEDSHSGGNNNNEHARKPVTIIAGDSIIQHIGGWIISRSNKQGGCQVFSRSRNHWGYGRLC